jgi:5-formyltetrahydrofolate cyclo-ligase
MSSNEFGLHQGTQEKDHIEAVSRSKQEIRDRVATKLLESGVLIPDPVFHLSLDHFIANFEGNSTASVRLIALPEWKKANRVFITPDRSTEFLRKIAIIEHKEVVVTTYGICRGAVLLSEKNVPYGQEEFAASLDGMEKFGTPLRTIEDVQHAGEIDLMVTGALAISESHGGRTGKGAGWFDAEWIMWRKMGLTTPDTPVAGIVHDLQIVPEAFELQPWDSLIQIITTPTRIIRTPLRPQPDQIVWDSMPTKWRDEIPLMTELFHMRVDMQTEP